MLLHFQCNGRPLLDIAHELRHITQITQRIGIEPRAQRLQVGFQSDDFLAQRDERLFEQRIGAFRGGYAHIGPCLLGPDDPGPGNGRLARPLFSLGRTQGIDSTMGCVNGLARAANAGYLFVNRRLTRP